MSELFRSQAVHAHRDKTGHVVPWTVADLRYWVWLLILWMLASLLLLAQVTYADKVSVDGIVQPTARPIVVRSPAVGVVGDVLVAQDTHVDAQQPLLQIDQRQHSTDGKTQAQRHTEQLLDKRSSLQRELATLAALDVQQRRMVQTQVVDALARQQTLTAQLKLSERRFQLLEKNARRIGELTRQGWISRHEWQGHAEKLLDAQQQVLSRRDQQQALQSRQRELEQQLRLQATQHTQRRRVVHDQLSQLDHELQQLSVSEAVSVHAPMPGRVVDMVAHVGQPVTAGSALLTLAPASAGHHPIEIFLPSAAAARVRAGMPVRVRYAGYPFQEHGAVLGVVGDISAVGRGATEGGSFRARIDVTRLPDGIAHVPAGMLAKVDVLLEAHALWEWLLHPVKVALARL